MSRHGPPGVGPSPGRDARARARPSRPGERTTRLRAARRRGRRADPDRWRRSVERFLVDKQREAPVGELWQRRMRWELLRFPRLARGPRPGLRSPREVSQADLDALRRACRWERATYSVHFAALRQFLAWARNPLATAKAPWRLPSGEPGRRRWISREALERLSRIPRGRARALVLLEGFNGLRRVELLRLRAKDVLFDERCLRVLGKGRNGGKWRRIPMHPAVGDELARLVLGAPEEARVFPISRSGADLLLQRAARQSGLTAEGVRVSHHDLRRTFGRLAHAAGMDLVQLKNLLGHASVDMTAHYVGLDTDEMRAGLERFANSFGPTERTAPRAPFAPTRR